MPTVLVLLLLVLLLPDMPQFSSSHNIVID
jgi:hypothetical protein